MANTESKFKAGMYLLETLTAGMYNEPLSIYREYVQNSVDSFDMVKRAKKKGPLLIKIDIDPDERAISAYDNGVGITAALAEKTFSSIGSSDKQGDVLRGFRGIGRLGGIAFCDKAVFQTKAFGEPIESVQEWNCRELKKLLSDTSKREMDIKSLFECTTEFYQNNGKTEAGSYFKVTLFNVTSFRNQILDIKKVQSYLQSVAPVPFSFKEFDHADEIRCFLSEKVPNYGEFTIKLNGEEILKPYKNMVGTSNKNTDVIEGVELLEIKNNDEIIAYGWYGKRVKLIGAINPRCGVPGIRIKAGNITIGDEHLIDKCFKENRFNGYMVGEIHVVSPKLIPNSRRDDFVDNREKALFYDAVERKIGLVLSKEIRLRSRVNSNSSISQPSNDTKHTLTPPASKDKCHCEPSSKVMKLSTERIEKILKGCGNCKKVRMIKEKLGY